MALIQVSEPIVSSSAGHGYDTNGKETPPLPQRNGQRMKEKEFNEAVQDYLAEELKRCGIKHVDVDHDKIDVPLETRAKRVNESGAHLHVEIHANAFDGILNDKAGGIETLYYETSALSKKVAQVVHHHVMQGTKMKDRGLKPGAWLYMIKNVKPVSILVELGFMDNQDDVKRLLSDEYRRECAVELAKAICEIFGKTYVPKPTPSPTKPTSEGYVFLVQVGAYENEDNAKRLQDELKAKGYKPIVIKERRNL
jgi:N-acetylmuramoyl-L-alanine amidase